MTSLFTQATLSYLMTQNSACNPHNQAMLGFQQVRDMSVAYVLQFDFLESNLLEQKNCNDIYSAYTQISLSVANSQEL
jgi:hypothetical protein